MGRMWLRFLVIVFGVLCVLPLVAQVKPRILVSVHPQSWGNSLCLAPGGLLAANGSDLWSVSTGALLRRIDGQILGFVDDQSILMERNKSLFFMDLATGKETVLAAKFDQAALARSVRRAVISSGNAVSTIDLASGKALQTWQTPGVVNILSVSADGETVVAGVNSPNATRAAMGMPVDFVSSVELWLPATGQSRTLLKLKGFPVELLALSPQGDFLVCNGDEFGLGNWVHVLINTRTAQPIKIFPRLRGPGWYKENPTIHEFDAFRGSIFAPDGRSFYTWGNQEPSFQRLQQWDASTGALIRELSALKGLTNFAIAEKNGTALGLTTQRLFAADLVSGSMVREMGAQTNPPEWLSLSSNGSPESNTRDIQIASEEIRLSNPGHVIASIAASKQYLAFMLNQRAVMTPPGDQVQIWRRGSQPRLIRTIDYAVTKGTSTTWRFIEEGDRCVFSPDGKSLVFGLGLFDAETGQARGLQPSPVKTGRWPSRFFSPDGEILAVLGETGLAVWNLATGQLLASRPLTAGLKGRALCLVSDGLFLGTNDGAIFWLAYAGGDFQELLPKGKTTWFPIESISLSQDRHRLLIASYDGRLGVFSRKTGTLVTTWNAQLGRILRAVESSSGNLLHVLAESGLVTTLDARTRAIVRVWASANRDDWIQWTPDGYFDGTDWAMKNLVHVVDGLKAYGIDQFFEQFHRPDIIMARLNGEDTSKIAVADLTKGFAEPPLVTLSFPSGTNPADGQLKVRVIATDQGGGIDGVRLFVGGKAVGENQRGLKPSSEQAQTMTRDYVVPLLAGDNALRAVGFSRDRTESAPAETLVVYKPEQVAKPNLYVVAAGADTYRNPRYRLDFALADVKGFLAALEPAAAKVFGRILISRVLESDLTRGKLIAALEEVKSRAQAQDVFLFFYAGHGIASMEGKQNLFYFVLPGVTQMQDDASLKSEGFSTRELQQAVGGIAANKQMLLVDACNSGAFLEGYATRGAAEENALAQLQRSSGMALFSASTDQQFANEVKDLGHGLFTWALMEGLRGEAATKDGRITASSLKAYIDVVVPELAQKYRGYEQFPLAKISGQDFPVGTKQ